MIIRKKFIIFIVINFMLVMALFLLYFIRNNKVLSIGYFILNSMVLIILSGKLKKETVFEIFVFMLLTYSYGIDVLIHYLGRNTYTEMRYLSLIPVIILFLKTNRIELKAKSIFPFLFIILLLLNSLLAIFTPGNSFIHFVESIIPYISFLISYFAMKNSDYDFRPLCKFLFVISVFLSTIQFLLHFHQDTRNGLFGVNGISILSIFMTSICIYYYSQWLRTKENLFKFLLSSFFAIYILFIIENKAGIVLLFLSFIFIPFFSKKRTLKTILSVIIFILLLPQAYRLLIYFNPNFKFLLNTENIVRYFTGNNNRRLYRYGRFESFNIVYNNLTNTRKVVGRGFGSSTPNTIIFYTEASREVYVPYYIRMYGINHGFQLTGLSTLVLDGGLILLIFVFSLLIRFYINVFHNLKDKDDNNFYVSSIQLNALLFFTFYLIYSNVFTSFKLLIMLAIILSLSPGQLLSFNLKKSD